MIKKTLPKAIVSTAAERTDPTLSATRPDAAVPELAEYSQDLNGTFHAARLGETKLSVQNGQSTSVAAEEENSQDASETSPSSRRTSAEKLVKRFSLWSGAAGLIPVPFFDLAAIGGLQIQMLRRISQIYGVPFSENRGKALIASIAGTMVPASSVIGAASMMKGMPVIGTIVSSIAMPTLSAGATYAIGMAFIQHFNSGGTLLDFNPPDYREFIKAHNIERGP